MNLAANVIIERYMAQVGQAMRGAGYDASAIEIVLEALHEQIEHELEALGQETITEDDARAVVATLAPISDYAEHAPSQHASNVSKPDDRRWLGNVSIGLCFGAIVVPMLIGFIGAAMGVETEEATGGLLVLGLAAGIVAGVFSRHTPQGRFGGVTSALLLVMCLAMSQI